MPFKIVRNDLTRMLVDVIVNTANEEPIYSSGTDTAVYKAAGVEELLAARREIGCMEEGEVAITPGFKLPAKYIIHAVSPFYINGKYGEEEKLRSCYRKSLFLALENGCESIAFPLISTGGFGYPKEEGMGIAVDEINKFLLQHDMMIYLVVFDEKATKLAMRLQPALDAYIDEHYVKEKHVEEYCRDSDFYHVEDIDDESIDISWSGSAFCDDESEESSQDIDKRVEESSKLKFQRPRYISNSSPRCEATKISSAQAKKKDYWEIESDGLSDRLKHLSDTFQEYLFYLIERKGLTNPEVYTDALITKQTFSKIKKNPNYHPDKTTALRLCIGARLSLDETKDLLARAGYALSPCDKMDVIFGFYIENEVYDIYAIDISLEKNGLPCFIG